MTHITFVDPPRAIEGGRISIQGEDFATAGAELPDVQIGEIRARVVFASPSALAAIVPSGLQGGRTPVRVGGVPGETAFVDVATPFATGLHQVDNPTFDRQGNLYVTYSGTRGQQVPVSIFRVRPDGTRESFSSGIVNPTSMALGPDERLYVSSRFEGTVYRLADDGTYETIATDLGVACGLAFARDGALLVGDRSGTIFRVVAGRAETYATLPPSVAAFHLAMAPDGALYATAPSLSSYDSVFRIDPDGHVTTLSPRFGRPQGLAFDPHGTLHVVEALAGVSGVYRLEDDRPPQLVIAGPGLVGLAFDSRGGMIVCSNDTAYRMAP